MSSSTSNFFTCKLLDPYEKHLTDSLVKVFESRLTVRPVSHYKQTIIDNPSIIPSKLMVLMFQFAIELVFLFPEFIEWCVSNYSRSERIIMNFNGSKFSCHINLQSIRETFSIVESNEDLIEQFSELSCLESVRGLGQSQL